MHKISNKIECQTINLRVLLFSILYVFFLNSKVTILFDLIFCMFILIGDGTFHGIQNQTFILKEIITISQYMMQQHKIDRLKFTLNNYLNPANITIPQYNFRFGYFIKDNIDVSFGIDHLKYVLEQNQLSRISGFIENSGTIYDGVYNNTLLPISEDFLKFEHSDGLNYINFQMS